MAHRIIWLPAAAQDLQEISDFVGQTSRSYADSLIGRMLDAVESLPAFPQKGPVVRDVRSKGVELREVSVRPYRVIYRLREGHVVVLESFTAPDCSVRPFAAGGWVEAA